MQKVEKAKVIEKEKLIDMYRTMVRHREFDNTILKEFAAGHVPGSVHLGQGQEAIGAGAVAAMRCDDYLTLSHRGAHGQLIARGEKTGQMLAEILGKKTGVVKGKGGGMHFLNVHINTFGGFGLMGSHVVVANGMALSAKLRGTDQITICFIGDGSLNTAPFHEGMNLASAWKLPLVLICENNTWAESTSIYTATNLTKLTDRAVAYNIPGIAVDGNDVLAVYDAVNEAISRARRGEGPTFIECKTCRWRGHSEGDTQTYRTKEEIEECMKKDPIPRFKNKLIGMKVLTERETEQIYQEALEEMGEALQFAEESSFPDPEDVLTDVYA